MRSEKSKSLILTSIVIALFIVGITVVFSFYDRIFSGFNYAIASYYTNKGDQAYKKGYKTGEFQEAVNNYTRALQIYPGYTKAQYNLGRLYIEMEDYYSAMDCYERILNIEPNYVDARISLGFILSEEIHDIDRAINEYVNAVNSRLLALKIPFVSDKSKSVKSSKALAYYNLALAYKAKAVLYNYNKVTARGYLIDAADSYRKSLEIEPNNYDARYNLGVTLHLLQNYSEAQEEYCKAIKINPVNYETHYNMALLLKQTGRYRDALKELENAGLILGVEGSSERSQHVFYALADLRQRVVFKPDKPDEQANKDDVKADKSIDSDFLSQKICKGN